MQQKVQARTDFLTRIAFKRLFLRNSRAADGPFDSALSLSFFGIGTITRPGTSCPDCAVARPWIDSFVARRFWSYSKNTVRNILKSRGIEPAPKRSRLPRWSDFKEECLSRMVFFGEKMLRHAVREFVLHHHAERNHQGLDNRLIEPAQGVGQATAQVVAEERLGGLLKYYRRKAA